jgi:LacI family transcriptional regulator
MATSEEVARLAGVSRATVSRALNGSPRVSEETRSRVHAAIAALGYEPDVVAQSLVRQRSRMIAVSLLPKENERPLSHFRQTSRYFYLSLMENIEQEAIASGYDLLMPSGSRGKSPENYLRSLQTRRVAGCIVLLADDARVQALVHSSLPAVFIDRMSQGSHSTYIKSDNIDGSRQAVEYLLSLGHRRIVFMTGPTLDLVGLERLLGCQQALAQAGFAPDPVLIRQSGWNIDQAYEAACILLAERRDFTAIVAGSDFMAMGIMRALTEHGLRVPDDVSLIGFDDIDLCQYTAPPLTTVRQDRVAMSRGAVQRLVAMIEGTEEAAPLIIPTQLVVRKSTGPAPKELH